MSDWKEIKSQPPANDKRSATAESAAVAASREQAKAKALAKLEALESARDKIQAAINTHEAEDAELEAQHVAAIEPQARQLEVLDQKEIAAITAGEPAPQLAEERIKIINERGKLNHAFELQSAKRTALASALYAERKRLNDQLKEIGTREVIENEYRDWKAEDARRQREYAIKEALDATLR